ncbi:hypothetical protein ACT453_11665, partial [Bacillus sp. D-CC]
MEILLFSYFSRLFLSQNLSSKIAKDEGYTIFLYEDKNKSVQSFAKKDFGKEIDEKNKKKVKFPIDSV